MWKKGLITLGEGIGMLDLAVKLKKHTALVQRGEITMCADNKCIINKYYNEVNKESDCAKKAEGIFEAIRREIKSMQYNVTLEYSNTKVNLS